MFVYVFMCKASVIVGMKHCWCIFVCVCVSVSCSIQMPQMCFRGTELHVGCGFGPVGMKMRGALICSPAFTQHRAQCPTAPRETRQED